MKNGYIIQGSVVERSSEAVTLGWPNGKVIIQRRFIDSVAYEAGEEKRLQDEEAFRAADPSTLEADPTLLASTEVEDLPATLDQLMQKHDISLKDPARGGEDPTAGAGEGGETATGTSTVLVPPSERLGERLRNAKASVSFRPPRDWTAKGADAAFQVVGAPDASGFRPSINIVVMAKGAFELDDYLGLLKQENAGTLVDYELIDEGPRAAGGEKGYELLGRASYQGRLANVRQVLVLKGKRLWLISAFASKAGAEDVFALFEESLKTFEFLNQ